MQHSAMDQVSKNGSRPTPDAIDFKPLLYNLQELLEVEYLHKSNVIFNENERNLWEVTFASRDGAVHILRFLRIWFDLPKSVFFNAVSYLDQFLARMKVQEKFLQCLTISCLYVAALVEGIHVNKKQLVSVSQTKCTEKDMLRMADIVRQKLGINNNTMSDGSENSPIVVDFLKVYAEIFEYVAKYYKADMILNKIVEREPLLTRLEVLMTDHRCAFIKPSVLSFVLIEVEMERNMVQGLLSEKYIHFLPEILNVLESFGTLKNTCQMRGSDLLKGHANVKRVIKEYDGEDKVKHSQNLLWRFSSSTYALCNKYRRCRYSSLGTIEERNQNC